MRVEQLETILRTQVTVHGSLSSDSALNIRPLGSPSGRVLDGQNLTVYGPTSVFDSQLAKLRDSSHVGAIMKLQRDPTIVHCIKLFFRWQYPDLNSFIVREAFLLEFFSPTPTPVYCSVELVLAICAMGSRMSDNAGLDRSWQYYNEAKATVLSKLDKPAIATMQAFLLLSHFDICNGNNSSGWMLAGCGIRMGFDLGFQLNPNVWFLKSSGSLSDLNVAIRSRIYWGCYFADHFISLVLGRPSVLKESDSSVAETGYLPDLEWISEYTYLGPGADPRDKSTIVDVSSPIKQLVRLIHISSDMLNDVFTRESSDVFDVSEKVRKSQHYNTVILEWRNNLPNHLKWTRQTLEQGGENPTRMFIRYYYYILLLCLNRPFLEATSNQEYTNVEIPAKSICGEIVDDLVVAIRRFGAVHGLSRSSIFIIYCCILAVSTILISNIKRGLDIQTRENLQVFLTALHQSSRVWMLAEKSLKLILSQLESLFKIGIEIIDSQVKLVVHENLHFSPTEFDLSNILGVNSDVLRDNFEIFGGPPLLMTSDLIDQEYDGLFSRF